MRHATLIPTIILMVACTPSTQQPSAMGQYDSTKLASHAIVDNRLRELMGEMNALILSEKEMTADQKNIELRKYNLKMAETAGSMGKLVDGILATLPSLKLNQTEQATFLALADKLRRDSTDLRNLALVGGNQGDAIPGQLDRIDVTCKACHQLFRTSGS